MSNALWSWRPFDAATVCRGDGGGGELEVAVKVAVVEVVVVVAVVVAAAARHTCIAVNDGRWPPGKMCLRMKSECWLQYASYRSSGSVITWWVGSGRRVKGACVVGGCVVWLGGGGRRVLCALGGEGQRVITWTAATPPGFRAAETVWKKEGRCSCPTASSISIEITLSKVPCSLTTLR
jgi:hypothetical protein